MELTPFTLEEAAEICEDFEDLVDTEFKIGASPELLVVNVCIAPFETEYKERFTTHYYQTKNSEESLSFYEGSDYDVILITSENDDDPGYSFIDIRTFASLRGIKYSFPNEN